MSEDLPPLLPPAQRGGRLPFDRERFVFKTLAVVICTQLLIYSLAAESAVSGHWRAGQSVRYVPARWRNCRWVLIPPLTCCWHYWAVQR